MTSVKDDDDDDDYHQKKTRTAISYTAHQTNKQNSSNLFFSGVIPSKFQACEALHSSRCETNEIIFRKWIKFVNLRNLRRRKKNTHTHKKHTNRCTDNQNAVNSNHWSSNPITNRVCVCVTTTNRNKYCQLFVGISAAERIERANHSHVVAAAEKWKKQKKKKPI